MILGIGLIHELVDMDILTQVYLLTLRRHEKDFILRNDEKYLDRLIEDAKQLDGLLAESQSKQ